MTFGKSILEKLYMTLKRNLATEQDELRRILESPGAVSKVTGQPLGGAFIGKTGFDVKDASSATQKLLQEQINMRVYGTASPKFTTTETSLPDVEQAKTGDVASPTSTAKPAESYLSAVDSRLTEYTNKLNQLYTIPELNDLGLTAAQQAYYDKVLASSERQESDLVASIKQNLQYQLQAAETGYKQTTGTSMSSLAKIGALGTTSAGVQYLNDLDSRYQSQLAKLYNDANQAIQLAQNARSDRDLEVLGQQLQSIDKNRKAFQEAESDRLNNIIKYQSILEYEKGNIEDTLDTMANAGVQLEELPDGYLETIDKQLGILPGTTALKYDAALRYVAANEQNAVRDQAIEKLNTFKDLGILSTLSDDEIISISSAIGVDPNELKNVVAGEDDNFEYELRSGPRSSLLEIKKDKASGRTLEVRTIVGGTVSTSGGGGGTGTAYAKDYFTKSQLAKGAANAQMSISEFGDLSVDEANSYIYEVYDDEDYISDLKNQVDIALAQGRTVNDIYSAIDTSITKNDLSNNVRTEALKYLATEGATRDEGKLHFGKYEGPDPDFYFPEE